MNMPQQFVTFRSPTHGSVSFDEMLALVAAYLKEDAEKTYEIAIGSDSQERSRHDGTVEIEYVTAITVRRLGNGGIFFYWRHSDRQSEGWPLRNRIYTETMLSATLAQEVRSHLRDTVGSDALESMLQLHVDVGRNGPTRRMIGEVLGIVSGYGLTVKIKPDAYCAAAVADRHT